MAAEQKTVATTGNIMVAEAMRQSAPDVMAAYPITPQTTIVEEYAKYVALAEAFTIDGCRSEPGAYPGTGDMRSPALPGRRTPLPARELENRSAHP